MQLIELRHIGGIINKACRAVGIVSGIGTHTLRKTWGYHAYKTFGMSLLDVMLHQNHSSLESTKHYLCLTDKHKQEISNLVSF